MPHYVNDPENPGQKIDAIELVRRNPLAPPPPDARIVDGLLKRDTWTRREAIAILAGANPRHAREYFHGVPIPTGYLDGTTALSLQAAGLSHPRESQIQADCTMLSGYAQGQPDDEQRMPSEWLAWAASKGYRPYWLAEPAPQSMAKQNKPDEQGDALTPGAIATMREMGWSEARIEAERRNTERIQAAGGFPNWVAMCEAARKASEARGYPVKLDDLAATLPDTARDLLDAELARGAPGGNIGWWARLFACELAAQRGEAMPDLGTCIEYENALAAAARSGQLTMRPYRASDFAEAVTPETTDKRLKDGLVVLKADMRAYAEQHAPGLLRSALLAEPAPKSAPAVEAATIAGPGKMGNSTKGKRAQPLSAEIEAAKREATNPDDAHSVYAVLQRWADERKAPFLGFVQGEGCKYQTPDGVEFFTLDALRKRMNRAAKTR